MHCCSRLLDLSLHWVDELARIQELAKIRYEVENRAIYTRRKKSRRTLDARLSYNRYLKMQNRCFRRM